MEKLRVGLLINPIAGIGGPAGTKGSDESWQQLLADGEQPTAHLRAKRFLAAAGKAIHVIQPPAALGIDNVGEEFPGLECTEIDFPKLHVGQSSADDTVAAAKELCSRQIDLLVIVGGDGSATDVARAIGQTTPCLGVPAGVKITSAVFSHDPEEAGGLVAMLAPGFPTTVRDVTDLDETAYRAGRLDVKLTGSLVVPESPVVQGGKMPSNHEIDLEGLTEMVLQQWGDGPWLVGAGSICQQVKKQFWGEPTLLGVDLIVGNRIVEKDLDAKRVRTAIANHPGLKVLLSPIGGQGMLIGRGTQVIPPDAWEQIGWENLVVVAPPDKLVGVRGLHADTGSLDFDRRAPTHIRVIAGWNETRMLRLLAAGE